VIHGSGSGRYPVGSAVHIWANPYEPGWTFDSWKGATEEFPDIRSVHVTLAMPSRDLQIEATYKQIPPWQADYDVIVGRDVYYYFPPVSKGVIIFFHGSGGDAREWTDLGAERRHFFDDAIADGYAIIAIDSADRLNMQWELGLPAETNLDIRAVRSILETLKGEDRIPAAMPIYGVGMSRGGRFATLAGYALRMKAVVMMVADVVEEIIPVSTVPMLWCLAERDVIIDRDQAFDNYQQLNKRGVEVSFYVHPQTPLYPLYFVNTNEIDYAASVQLFADLKENGFLDENNFLIENPRFSGWEKLAADYPEEIRIDLWDRLLVAYGEHAFYSDCDHRILDFFDAHP
jgi:predicted esterase